MGVKSLIDLGCGRGISTSYFMEYGVDALCVEGSHDAVQKSLLPRDNIVEHDFTRGPWWPNKTFDAVWSVEFLEHVGRMYIKNYMPILKKSALIFVTASTGGGWHHVEIREPWWWRGRFTAAGFVYSEELTTRVRHAAAATNVRGSGMRIAGRMMVFINPSVASLPEHDHLFAGDGCIFKDETDLPCNNRYKWFTEVDNVPAQYQALLTCKFQPQAKVNISDYPGFGVYNCTRNEKAFGSF